MSDLKKLKEDGLATLHTLRPTIVEGDRASGLALLEQTQIRAPSAASEVGEKVSVSLHGFEMEGVAVKDPLADDVTVVGSLRLPNGRVIKSIMQMDNETFDEGVDKAKSAVKGLPFVSLRALGRKL